MCFAITLISLYLFNMLNLLVHESGSENVNFDMHQVGENHGFRVFFGGFDEVAIWILMINAIWQRIRDRRGRFTLVTWKKHIQHMYISHTMFLVPFVAISAWFAMKMCDSVYTRSLSTFMQSGIEGQWGMVLHTILQKVVSRNVMNGWWGMM